MEQVALAIFIVGVFALWIWLLDQRANRRTKKAAMVREALDFASLEAWGASNGHTGPYERTHDAPQLNPGDVALGELRIDAPPIYSVQRAKELPNE